jgi:hypothetical protein
MTRSDAPVRLQSVHSGDSVGPRRLRELGRAEKPAPRLLRVAARRIVEPSASLDPAVHRQRQRASTRRASGRASKSRLLAGPRDDDWRRIGAWMSMGCACATARSISCTM